ncbi:MAG: LLM class F420-dependent oxidoreductase [Antricoccus sp.]
MKLAIHLAKLTWPGGPVAIGKTMGELAAIADETGVATITLMDHYFQMEHFGGPFEDMLEGYTSLGFLAGQTSNVELGLMVTGVTYRHPGLLAKIVTTLDVLSSGRAMLGLGAAWYEREHLGLGVPYPAVAERFERLEETIEICNQMWSANDGRYDGKHFQLAETICLPQPLHRPRLMIGGSGEKKTLRMVAQYADACNLFGTSVADVQHKLDVLAAHCDRLDRDVNQISKTITGAGDPGGDPEKFLAQMQEYSKLGIDQVWAVPNPDDPIGWMSRVGEQVLPSLAAI